MKKAFSEVVCHSQEKGLDLTRAALANSGAEGRDRDETQRLGIAVCGGCIEASGR